MIIRQLKQEDVPEHYMVASQAFIFPVSDNDLKQLPNERLICAFDDDDRTMLADMEITAFYNNFCGNILKCAGVGGVASKPEHRRKGAVRKLFDYLFENLAETEGYDISILYPFSSSYYRKFGYETAGYKISCTFPFSEFSDIERSSDVTILNEKLIPEINVLYNKIALKDNLSFRRKGSAYFSTEPMKTNCYTYMWKSKSGEYRAYATYRFDRNASRLNVEELGYLDKESLLGILGFLRVYDGNAKEICFNTLPSYSPIRYFTRTEQNGIYSQNNMGAVRILNMESVLSKKSWPIEKGEFSFKCNDAAGKNSGVYFVKYENGKAVSEKVFDDPQAEIELDINAASKIILCGIADYTEASYIPGVKIYKENPDFIRAFPVMNTFFNDGF